LGRVSISGFENQKREMLMEVCKVAVDHSEDRSSEEKITTSKVMAREEKKT